METVKFVVITARAKVPEKLADCAMNKFQGAIDSLKNEVNGGLPFDLYKIPTESPRDLSREQALVELGYDAPAEPSDAFDPWED